jgi:mannitol-1-/sugar-/sorbitol-6-phosphatase
VLVAADDVSTGKPSPEGYLKAAASLGRDIAACLVVEDAPAGVQPGRAAGARVLAVATTHRGRDLSGADVVASDLSSLTVAVTPGGLLIAV